jgi:hypothetical protein
MAVMLLSSGTNGLAKGVFKFALKYIAKDLLRTNWLAIFVPVTIRPYSVTAPTRFPYLTINFASIVLLIGAHAPTRLVSVAKRIKALQIAGFLRFMDMIFLDLNMCVASHVCL